MMNRNIIVSVTCVHIVSSCIALDRRPRTSPMKSGRRKGVSPGQPTKHDQKICGRRNVENMQKVNECYKLTMYSYCV